MDTDYRGCRATIMGLGHFGGGVAAARWLAAQGAIVTVTDQAEATDLAESVGLLHDVSRAAISLSLGGHRAQDFCGADLVVVNPAVRPNSPWLDVARQSGATLCTEIELFMKSCAGTVVGVTGSNGKSTTAAMIAAIFRAAGRRVFLGGNIGGSLLENLPEIGRDDWVVLEISSFQLWHFRPNARMPHVAVVTGCTPNHLDWHDDFSHYATAKQRILVGQTVDDVAALNTRDPEVATWLPRVRGRLAPLPSEAELPPLAVSGAHNRSNAACAMAAAVGAGCNFDAVCQGLQSYQALPQRLEFVMEINGRKYFNDSTATTPESTIAALHALPMPVWLMAGGKNKGFDFHALATEIVGRARGAAFFGNCRKELFDCVTSKAAHFSCVTCDTMTGALHWCQQHAQTGEAILLSPGCASTDQFRNFRERGERFVELLTKNGTMV